MECEGIGPDRAEAIAEWFADEDNLRLVDELRELGLTLKTTRTTGRSKGPLTGRQYVITGTLESILARAGAGGARGARGEGLRHVSKKTTAVFVGENPGPQGQEGPEGRRAGADRSGARSAARRSATES